MLYEFTAVLICVFWVGEIDYMCIFCGMLAAEIGIPLELSFRINTEEKNIMISLISLSGILCILEIGISTAILTRGISLPLCFSGVILLAHVFLQNKKITRIARLVERFGKYSFSFYLFHFLIIETFGAWLFVINRKYQLMGDMAGIACVFFACIILTIAVAIIFQRCLLIRWNKIISYFF